MTICHEVTLLNHDDRDDINIVLGIIFVNGNLDYPAAAINFV